MNIILNIIITQINRKGQAFYDKCNNENPNGTKVYEPIDSTEIEAYIGIEFILGALHASKDATDML